MNANKIFIGPVYKVTKYEFMEKPSGPKVDKEFEVIPKYSNAILIEIKDNEYVLLENFHLYLYLRKFFPSFKNKVILKDLDLLTLELGKTFIRKENLKPYLIVKANKPVEAQISLKKVKKRQARK